MCIHLKIFLSRKNNESEQIAFVQYAAQYLPWLCSSYLLSFTIEVHNLDIKDNFYETNYPVNDSGSTCSYDQPNFPYIYFANPNDLSSGRYCVSTCPNVGEPLICSQ